MVDSEDLLAIDPGRDKCGLALVNHGGDIRVVEIVPSSEIIEKIADFARSGLTRLVIGNGTYSRQLIADLGFFFKSLSDSFDSLSVFLIDERSSTLEARELYFEYNPPSGLRKLIPRGLLSPQGPIDQYAALVLARRFLNGHLTSKINF